MTQTFVFLLFIFALFIFGCQYCIGGIKFLLDTLLVCWKPWVGKESIHSVVHCEFFDDILRTCGINCQTCVVCIFGPPPPPGFPTGFANRGGSSKFDGGGLKSKHGGSLKCSQKIPVKEFI